MKRIVTAQYLDRIENGLGIRSAHAIAAAESPDQEDRVQDTGLEIRLSSKWVDKASPPFHLLVIEKCLGDEAELLSAYRIYPDLCPDVSDLRPLQMLEQLCERFGAALRSGSRNDRFIIKETISVSGPDDLEVVQLGLGRESLDVSMFVQFNKETAGMSAKCALCYCIRVDAYKKWMQKHVA